MQGRLSSRCSHSGDSLGVRMWGQGSGLAPRGAWVRQCPVQVGCTGVGGGWLRRCLLVTGLFLCSLSLSLSPGPHFWELSLLGSCSGPQFLPGTGGLSLTPGISLAGSLSPAARPAMWAAGPSHDTHTHTLACHLTLQTLLGCHLPGSPPGSRLVKSLGLDFPCSGVIPGLEA